RAEPGGGSRRRGRAHGLAGQRVQGGRGGVVVPLGDPRAQVVEGAQRAVAGQGGQGGDLVVHAHVGEGDRAVRQRQQPVPGRHGAPQPVDVVTQVEVAAADGHAGEAAGQLQRRRRL